MKSGRGRLLAIVGTVLAGVLSIVSSALAASTNIWTGLIPPDWAWAQDAMTMGVAMVALAVATAILAAASAYVGMRGASRKDPSLDELADELARVVYVQWDQAAKERRLLSPKELPIRWLRSSEPPAGAPDSAFQSTRFMPLPGCRSLDITQFRDAENPKEYGFEALYRIYGGLRSGRLLLIGRAGSGKSSAGILLLRRALQSRFAEESDARRAQIPVPVMFTLHGWNPDTENDGVGATDWLAGKLVETYSDVFGQRRDLAVELLKSGRVTVFLDGLDEVIQHRRDDALNALEWASFRVVLATRGIAESPISRKAVLANAFAVELLPVKPADAADYIRRGIQPQPPAALPVSWREISRHLYELAAKPGDLTARSALSEALESPLLLRLLLDVYRQEDPVDELLDGTRFPTASVIENHLLQHAIRTAYTPLNGEKPPPYKPEVAHRTLHYLARKMAAEDTRELAWWHIPTWTNRRPRTPPQKIDLTFKRVVLGLALGLFAGVAGWLLSGFVGKGTEALASVVVTLSLILVLVLAGRTDQIGREPTELLRQDRIRSMVLGGAVGIIFGPLLGYGVWVGGSVFGANVGLVAGLMMGVATTLAFGVASGPIFSMLDFILKESLFSVLDRAKVHPAGRDGRGASMVVVRDRSRERTLAIWFTARLLVVCAVWGIVNLVIGHGGLAIGVVVWFCLVINSTGNVSPGILRQGLRRALLTGAAIGLIAGVATGFAAGPIFAINAGIATILGLASDGGGGNSDESELSPGVRFIVDLVAKSVLGIGIGLVVGLVLGLASIPVAGISFGLSAGVTSSVVSGFIFGLSGDADRIQRESDTALEWGHNKAILVRAAAGIGIGILFGFLVGLVTLLLVGMVSDIVVGAVLAIGVGLAVALMAGAAIGFVAGFAPLPASIELAFACLVLKIRYRTPLRLIRFLEDARSRHLLRVVGPLYQFRHANLQDRLANSVSADFNFAGADRSNDETS